MSRHHALDLATRLGNRTGAAYRHYSYNGRREVRSWLIGKMKNAPGRFRRSTGCSKHDACVPREVC